MRVHPALLSTRSSRWQFAAAFAVLLFLLIVTVFKGPKEVVVAAPAPSVNTMEVVVAKKAIKPGLLLTKAEVAVEKRPVNTLPSDVVRTLDALKGKIAAGPIPAGYPLAQALMIEPTQIVKEEKPVKPGPEDPVDVMLKKIEANTVAVPIVFSSAAPSRGSRVALALSSTRGDTVLVLDDGWISESAGNRATLRVNPEKALFLQSARKLGAFSFIQIPAEGKSPYIGQSQTDIAALEIALGLRKKPVQKNSMPKVTHKAVNPKRFKNYAWIKGTGQRYGIDDNGMMYVVDSTGREIGPVLKEME